MIIGTLSSFAQGNEQGIFKHEIGISASSLNSFGAVYRFGKNNSMWRASIVSFGISNLDTDTETETGFEKSTNFQIAVGKEFRKELNKNFKLRLGADLFYDYDHYQTNKTAKDKSLTGFYENNDKVTATQYGLKLVLGVNYSINSHLVVGAEINPSLSLYNEKTNGSIDNFIVYEELSSERSGTNIGFFSNFALLTLVYQFGN